MKFMTRLSLIVSAAWLLQWFGGTAVMAKTMYVSEDVEINMRTGPATDHKIIALVPSGSTVENIETAKGWSRVRLANGKEGWVLTRYLTETTPAAIKLKELETRYAEVVERNKLLEQNLTELSTESRATGGELDQMQAELSKVKSEYETLKKESADFLKFKAAYEKNVKDLAEARQAAETFESERNRLANSQLIDGVLYGGGLVIFGLIAGWILKKPKQRSGLI